MAEVTPFLWFDDEAESALAFYTSLLPESEIVSVRRYPDGDPLLAGKVAHAHARIAGADYFAMDAGPQYRFTPALSLYVSCADQEEVDRIWNAFVEEGAEEMPCGWLTDRWGLSWQIIPERLIALLRDPDAERAARATGALLTMRRIDIAAVENAARE
jgi:predicted 3-demethylubiquinone-9 3-methyltransferase (glyoxalase superfamily)